MRAIVLVLACIFTASCGPSRAHSPFEVEAPAGVECVPYATSEKMVASVEAANEDRYRRALAEQGFEAVTLKGWAGSRQAGGKKDERRAPWSETTEDRGGTKVRVLVGPEGYIACGANDPSKWPFARNTKGELYHVEQRRRPGASKTIYVCGCMADVPATCGGAAPEPVQWYFEMPEGATFQGSLPFEYIVDTASPAFVGRADSSECPTPTAPP